METITKTIDEQFEVTVDRDEIADYISDFIRESVKKGDPETLVLFLAPAVNSWINACHAKYTRRIRLAAAERVDGFGGPVTFSTSTGEEADVEYPGVLDEAVLADTYKINGVIYRVGDMHTPQHESMVGRYRSNIDTLQIRVDFHLEAIRILQASGASCLNDLV